jgi:uncharacterized protein (DUF1015 family)
VERVSSIQAAFASIERLYIADGHHRSAAASRIHGQRGDAVSEHFLAGLYPSDSLQVLAYNRVIHDLNGEDASSLLAKIEAAGFAVTADAAATPAARGTFSMYLAGQWYGLTPGPELRSDHPVAGLDVAILQDNVLGPLLGIDDPRRSSRVTFVGGIHGAQALKAAVDAGQAVAFHLYPTGLDQLFAVADVGAVMPPKSTWFEPKLREGVAIRAL